MNSSESCEIRVLAIDPSMRGFGFAVLEGPDRLIDDDKDRRSLKLIADLIDQY